MPKVFSTLLVLLLFAVSASHVLAQDEPARLSIEALDADGHFFDISLEPGESAELTVRFANHGGSGAEADIFAADVYTIHGGGLGVRDIDEPRSGATDWLDFPTETLELVPGEPVDRTFTITVPEAVEPGDYITGLVVQNSDSDAIESGADSEQFHQSVRQGIAVAIDVPGPREPAMSIDGVTHNVSDDRSMILVGIENTGNTHLRPTGEFSFSRSGGNTLARTTVELDSVYAGTNTRLEIVLSDALPTGDYVVSLNLMDEETGATSSTDALTFTVPETEPAPAPEPTASPAAAAGTTSSNSGPGLVMLLWIVAGVAMLSATLAGFAVYHQRSGGRPSYSGAAAAIPAGRLRHVPAAPPIVNAEVRPAPPAAPADAPRVSATSVRQPRAFGRATEPKPIRQLIPSRRAR